MPKLKLDAISITSVNFAKTVQFYSLLGFEFPAFTTEEKHIEPFTKNGEVRLMIDDAEFMKSMTGIAPKPPTHSSFAMKCTNAEEVDACAASIKAAGFKVEKEPWNAFWGQRYAIVVDPDGYQVDLFAWMN
jgi:uncharacterized glyoxalase superfamily protein PhnB